MFDILEVPTDRTERLMIGLPPKRCRFFFVSDHALVDITDQIPFRPGSTRRRKLRKKVDDESNLVADVHR